MQLAYDGNLTRRPVSNSSTTYQNAGYGHMDDAIRLGYQAAMVSMHSPAYGRFWLSVVPHPGNTASCTQLATMVLAAEAKTGLRPLRRTDLLRGRLQGVSRERQGREEQVQAIETELAAVQAQETETRRQIDEQRALVAKLEAGYREKQRPERPYSTLGRARHKLGVRERRQARLAKKVPKLEEQLARRKGQLAVCQAQESQLQWRDVISWPAPVKGVWLLERCFFPPCTAAAIPCTDSANPTDLSRSGASLRCTLPASGLEQKIVFTALGLALIRVDAHSL